MLPVDMLMPQPSAAFDDEPNFGDEEDGFTSAVPPRNLDSFLEQQIKAFIREELVAADFASASDLAALDQRVCSLSDSIDHFHKMSSLVRVVDNTYSNPATASSDGSCKTYHSFFVQNSNLTYKLKFSLWDASLLCGAPSLRNGVTFALTSCIILNLFLVAMFSVVLKSIASDTDFTQRTVMEFDRWRTTVAHHVDLRNPVTGESLASSICNNRLSIPFSNSYLSIYSSLEKYLTLFGVFGFDSNFAEGAVMCSLGLLVWYFTLVVEVRNTLHSTLVCFSVPCIRHCRLEHGGGGDLRLIGISTWARIIVLVFFVIRMCVVGVLAWYGTLFLIHEVSVSDILLNAVSMNLVLNLDELLFDALIPQEVPTLIAQLQPIKLPHPSIALYNYIEFVGIALGITIGITCVMLNELSPLLRVLRDSREALCGGVESSLNFVLAVDSIGLPWAASTPSAQVSGDLTYAEHVTLQAKELGFASVSGKLQPTERSNLGWFMYVKSGRALMTFQSVFGGPADWGYDIRNPNDFTKVIGWSEVEVFGPNGVDFGSRRGTVYNRYLRFLLAVPSAENISCAQVPFSRCVSSESSDSVVIRQLCPSRCGCDDPIGGAASNPEGRGSRFLGCVRWNLRKKRFQDTIGALPCRDSSVLGVFASWALGLGELEQVALAKFHAGRCPEVVRMVLGYGHFPICRETSLPSVCPESCGCSNNASFNQFKYHALHHSFCPHSCKHTKPPCFTISRNDYQLNVTYPFGPIAGYACIFPFLYKGKQHTTCMSEDYPVPWCAVTTSRNGEVVNWGDCPYHNCSRNSVSSMR